MSKGKKSDSYEVGYRKPPKHTRFQKGVSGNPKGRPIKAPDFDAGLVREGTSRVTINENGRRVRISMHNVIVKQTLHGAMKGKKSDLQIYRDACRRASEKAAALSAAAEAESRKTIQDYTTAELLAMLEAEHEKMNKG